MIPIIFHLLKRDYIIIDNAIMTTMVKRLVKLVIMKTIIIMIMISLRTHVFNR